MVLRFLNRYASHWHFGQSKFDVGLASVMALTLTMASVCSHAAECIKTVRWYDDAPYSFKGPQGEIHGFDADLVRNVLGRMQCTARFVEMPWARALVELERGRLDILPGALRTPQREQFAHFSVPVNRSPNVLFISQSAAQKYRLNKLADIAATDFRLGAQIDVFYGEDYATQMNNPEFSKRIDTITSRRSAWKMMELGRIDGLIADEVSALTELQQLGLSDLVKKTGVITSTEPATIAFSKRTIRSDFVVRFNAGFAEALADGSYKTIRERYIPCAVSLKTLGCN